MKKVKIGPVSDLKPMVVALGCFDGAGHACLAKERKSIAY
jgi:FAD synthase